MYYLVIHALADFYYELSVEQSNGL